MKNYCRKGVLRMLTALVAFFVALNLSAENRLYVENFTVMGNDPIDIPVMLDNTDEVAALNFTMKLPEGLEFTGKTSTNPERFNTGQSLSFSSKSGVAVVMSMNKKNFKGESGPLFWIQVKPNGKAVKGQTYDLTLNNIVLSTAAGGAQGQVPSNSEWTAEVSFPSGVATSSTSEDFIINPGGTHRVSFSMTNDFEVAGISVVITLPEGFSIAGEEAQLGTRAANSMISLTPREDGVSYGCIIIDMMGNPCVTGNSGEVFWFDVVAPENFSAETAQITFSQLECSLANDNVVNGEGCHLTMTNGVIAYNKANTEIASLQDALADALTEINEKAPSVKDIFTGDAIGAEITALKANVEAAYADGSLTPGYASVMAPAATIRENIARLVNEAISAEADKQAELARQQALENANAAVASLEAKLAEALLAIATDAPDVKDNFKGENVSARIQALKDAVKAAYDNKTIVEGYDALMAPVPSIEGDITKLVENAREAQKAYEQQEAQKALDNAKKNADAAVASLRSRLDKANKTIDTFTDVAAGFKNDVLAIDDEIDALAAAVADAYADASLVANYETVVTTPAAELEVRIASLVDTARAAQEKYEADTKANNEAKVTADAAVAEMEKALSDALARINTECPDVASGFDSSAIAAEIEAVKTAAAEAYANRTLFTEIDNILSVKPAVMEEIARLVDTALAAQKDHETQLSLDKALEDANSMIVRLQDELNVALNTIATECPDVAGDYQGASIAEAISNLQNAVNSAYADGTLADNYDEVTAPAAGISADITTLVNAAVEAQKAYEIQMSLDTAKAEADKLMVSLRGSLDETLATIATDCPDVKDNFTGAEISEAIANLQQTIDAAYADGTLANEYNEVTAPAAGISTDISALLDAARAAQKAYEDQEAQKALDAAKENAETVVADLRTTLDKASETIGTFPGVAADFKNSLLALGEDIDALAAAVAAAYADGSLVANYEGVVTTPAADLNERINVLVDDARAAQEKYDADTEANDKAKATADAAVAEMEKALADALARINTECPDVASDFDGSSIASEIETVKAAAAEAYANRTLFTDLDNILSVKPAVMDEIARLVEAAITAQKDHETQSSLDEHLEYANGIVKMCRNKLNDALSTIATECPDVAADYQGEAITEAIDNLQNAALAAYAHGTLVENYQEIMAPCGIIFNDITALVNAACEAQKAFDEDKVRKEANLAAFNADMEKIEALQTELDEAVAYLQAEYPDYDVTSHAEAIQEAIDAQKAQAEEAYADCAEEGYYENIVDSEGIRNMIEEFKKDVICTGINIVLGEKITDDVKIFNIHGEMMPAVQRGAVNILVMPDGTVKKVYVK